MRIAVVAPNYAPVVGGVETVVTHVARALVAGGCEIEVWTHRRTGLAADEIVDGVRVRRFTTTPSMRYPLSPSLWRHTVRYARDFDVVHAHSYHSTAALGAALRRLSAPVVVTPHYHGVGHTRAAKAMHVAYRPIGTRLLTHVDAIVAVSAAEEALLRNDFPALATVDVVTNGVDTDAIATALRWPDEPPTVLVAGRLEPYKRVDRVIAAFARVTAPGQLVIAGDGPDRSRLERAAGRNVRFVGRVSDGDLARWLRTARGVVSLSEHEAFGLVAAEGVAAGARAIVSDIPAHREVAAMLGPDARVVDAGDVDAVVSALDDVLAVPNGGPRSVRSWNDVAADYLAVYERVVSR